MVIENNENLYKNLLFIWPKTTAIKRLIKGTNKIYIKISLRNKFNTLYIKIWFFF